MIIMERSLAKIREGIKEVARDILCVGEGMSVGKGMVRRRGIVDDLWTTGRRT